MVYRLVVHSVTLAALATTSVAHCSNYKHQQSRYQCKCSPDSDSETISKIR